MDDGIFRLSDDQEAYIGNPLPSVPWMRDDMTHRRAGRTTAIAHQILRKAWAEPGQWVSILDHYPHRMAHQNLATLLQGLIAASGLGRHMELRTMMGGPSRLRVVRETLG